ncbi:MAG: VWA domain-containing protein [Robiginitomaculum sp.]|nr:VWA domain-containing protein [Robiginitomaculum sp.]
MPLTNDKSALNNKVSEMKPVGWTYVPEGLAWGWRVLSSPVPYDQGASYADQDWKKVLVLMTDGENTVKWSWDKGWPKAKTNTTKTSGDQKTKTLCRNIKDEGITIYTVAFQVNSSSTRNMLEDCASSTDHYFDAQNNSALEAAFAKIAGDINNLRLSK